MSEHCHRRFPRLMYQSNMTEHLQHLLGLVAELLHPWILGLPASSKLLDHQAAIAADCQTDLPRISVSGTQLLQGVHKAGLKGPVFSLIIRATPPRNALEMGRAPGIRPEQE